LFSLLLSIGIGMISGGVQHFTDFPLYSSYLIPLGLVLSFVAFLLKGNYMIKAKIWSGLFVGAIIISTIFNFGLMAYANSLIANKTTECSKISSFINIKVQASGDHEDGCKITKSKNTKVNSKIVTSDKTFIEYVIPHHIDAVESSQSLLQTTTDPELKTFLTNVIANQGKEITTLKSYYKTWFNQEYAPNSNYQKMMKLDNKTGIEADQKYIQGMFFHHSGIIDIAKGVLTDSSYQYKSEILEFSRKIIKDQEFDNIILKNWLETKYKNSSAKTTEEEDGQAH
jgi:uncharacterized protein (DUF305 family)